MRIIVRHPIKIIVGVSIMLPFYLMALYVFGKDAEIIRNAQSSWYMGLYYAFLGLGGLIVLINEYFLGVTEEEEEKSHD